VRVLMLRAHTHPARTKKGTAGTFRLLLLRLEVLLCPLPL